jgi:hypothetical protein
MNTQAQTQTKRVSIFGLVATMPAAGCVAYLAYSAFSLQQTTLAVLFTLVGAAVAFGGTRIR